MTSDRPDRRGRPDLEETDNIKEKILAILQETRVAHPGRIRTIYSQNHERVLSRATVRKYLDRLKEEGKIREEVITEGKTGRTISIVKINY